MKKNCMSKQWVLDPQDRSCPEELKDEIFETFQYGRRSNESYVKVSISSLKENYANDVEDGASEDEYEYGNPFLIKFLKDQGIAEDETVYILIWW